MIQNYQQTMLLGVPDAGEIRHGDIITSYMKEKMDPLLMKAERSLRSPEGSPPNADRVVPPAKHTHPPVTHTHAHRHSEAKDPTVCIDSIRHFGSLF